MTGRIEHLEKYTAYYNSYRQYHREDGPAVEYANGYKLWYINGKVHREDGPAIEYPSGRTEWRINGKLHRVDGPAITFKNGSKEWYNHGNRHRADGPAIEWPDGDKEWYIHGKNITDEVNQWREEMGITDDTITEEETVLFMLYFGNFK